MTSINLSQNEQAVLAAAVRIYSGFIVTGKVNKENFKEAMKHSLWAAGMMSDEIDVSTRIELVEAEGEEVPFPW